MFNRCYRDALITSGVNCGTSFLAGFAVFSVLGHMAHVQRTSVENVARDGKSLYSDIVVVVTLFCDKVNIGEPLSGEKNCSSVKTGVL